LQAQPHNSAQFPFFSVPSDDCDKNRNSYIKNTYTAQIIHAHQFTITQIYYTIF